MRGKLSERSLRRNGDADEGIIAEYEGGLMTGRMIQKYYSALGSLK
jgi:hypothetical protein